MIPAIKTKNAITVVLALAFAATPPSLHVQTAEIPVANEIATTATSEANETTIVPTSDVFFKVEMEHRFNEFRSQYLDDRAKSINWWLAIIAAILTFFGVVVAIAGIVGFRRFRDIETEARGYVEEIKAHKEQAEKDTGTIRKLTSADAANPTKAEQMKRALEEVQQAPDVPMIDKAIANAHSLHKAGKIKEAIEKWQTIANLMEGINNEIAARAWFSVGYLYQEGGLEDD